jgi:hypothetical protein
MKIINLNEITNGMQLAEPVINNFGQILMTKGTSLAERHIKLLKTWNISRVSIVDDIETEPQDVTGYGEDIQEMARKILATRLIWIPRNEAEQDLYNMALIHTIKNIVEKR